MNNVDKLDLIKKNLNNPKINAKIIFLSLISFMSAVGSWGMRFISFKIDNEDCIANQMMTELWTENSYTLYNKDMTPEEKKLILDRNIELVQSIMNIHFSCANRMFFLWTVGQIIGTIMFFTFLTVSLMLLFLYPVLSVTIFGTLVFSNLLANIFLPCSEIPIYGFFEQGLVKE
jgi:hypothetical protein